MKLSPEAKAYLTDIRSLPLEALRAQHSPPRRPSTQQYDRSRDGRAFTMQVRLTLAEKQALVAAAARAGVTPSEWLRQKINGLWRAA